AVIVILFTKTYLAAVPILRIWCLMVVPSAFAVDGVLRAHARTRFLLVMNVVRLVVIVGLVGWLISGFGIVGAVLGTLVGTVVVKMMAMVQNRARHARGAVRGASLETAGDDGAQCGRAAGARVGRDGSGHGASCSERRAGRHRVRCLLRGPLVPAFRSSDRGPGLDDRRHRHDG